MSNIEPFSAETYNYVGVEQEQNLTSHESSEHEQGIESEHEHDSETEIHDSHNMMIGGCSGTLYGCCPDGKTPAEYFGDKCNDSSEDSSDEPNDLPIDEESHHQVDEEIVPKKIDTMVIVFLVLIVVLIILFLILNAYIKIFNFVNFIN